MTEKDTAGKSGFITMSDGAELFYRDEGRGSPIIFMHGWSASLDCFDGAVSELRRSRRCVRFDMRGHGRSSSSYLGLTMDRLAGDLREVMRRLGAEGASVVGHSMGGLALYAYFCRYGDDGLSAAAVMDMSPKPLRSPGWDAGMRFAADPIGDGVEFFAQSAADAGRRCLGSMAEAVSDAAAVLTPGTDAATMSALWFSMLNSDYRGGLKNVAVPFTYFLPENGIYPEETAAFIASQVRGPFRLVRLPGENHMSMLRDTAAIVGTIR